MKVYLDSNIFIYHTLKDPKRGKQCKALFKKIDNKQIEATTSALALCEIHYNINKYLGSKEATLAIQFLLSSSIEFVDVDLPILVNAVNKAHKHKLEIFDAVHLATALTNSVDVMYTYDKDFDKVIKRVEP